MNIGIITRHNYPTGQEIRVTKTAATLKAAGYEVTVFCPGKVGQAEAESFEHGRIIRLRLKGGFFAKFYSPLPISPLWKRWLFRQFKANSMNLVIVRDLRLALPVFAAAKRLGIPAILDIGEHYPGMMKILGKQNPTHYITRNNWLITRLEKLSAKRADRVWVVVEENRQRLKKYSSNIEVISNYPSSSPDADIDKSSQHEISPNGKPVTLISLGLIDNIRGLDLAIDGFAIVAAELDNVQLQIYGDGPFRHVLEQQVKELRLQDKVYFGGWVEESKKYKILASGDIGLLLHRVCELTQHTIPNKLFDYMYVGLPVFSTKLEPVAQVLDIEQCGIAVDETPEAVAKGMIELIKNFDLRQQYAVNGYTAVRARYKWDDEAAKIITDVERLIGRSKTSNPIS